MEISYESGHAQKKHTEFRLQIIHNNLLYLIHIYLKHPCVPENYLQGHELTITA